MRTFPYEAGDQQLSMYASSSGPVILSIIPAHAWSARLQSINLTDISVWGMRITYPMTSRHGGRAAGRAQSLRILNSTLLTHAIHERSLQNDICAPWVSNGKACPSHRSMDQSSVSWQDVGLDRSSSINIVSVESLRSKWYVRQWDLRLVFGDQ